MDYIRMHRSNIPFQESNKHEIDHFSHLIFTCARVMSCRTRERAKCHMHTYHTRTNVLHPRATHVQTHLSAYAKRWNVLVKNSHFTMTARKIWHAQMSHNTIFLEVIA